MSKQYVSGGRMCRCPDCEVNWDEGKAEIRSYDPETGVDKLLYLTPAGEHPDNGCPRYKKPV